MKDYKLKGTARLTYTVLYGGLEHLKIETRLIDERFPSVMGECENVTLKVSKSFFIESRKGELKTKPTYECRCDERLKTKTEKSTRLTYTTLGLLFVYYESMKRKLI